MTTVPYRQLLSGHRPHAPLMKRLKSHAGRNHRGAIMVRHQGGGNRKLYREVEFGQAKLNVGGRVETVEYDPYRTAFIALVSYRDGDRRYLLAPQGLKVGDEVLTAPTAPIKPGNRMELANIPVGAFVYNVEVNVGGGGKLVRSAGGYAEVLAHEGARSILRLGSKETRTVPSKAFASIGQVSNPDWNLVNIGKAGRSRWLGIRPTVRGSAMNPVDHPYGGGEGAQPRGTKRPKTMWGKVTGGHKTRNRKKWSSKFILTRRPKVR